MSDQIENNNNLDNSSYDIEHSIEDELTMKTSANWLKAADDRKEDDMHNKWFYCVQCKFMFSQKSLLDKHMQLHPKFNCFKIEYKTSVEKDSKNTTQNHDIENVCKLKCSKCSFSTRRESTLASHTCKPFICKLCVKEYTHQSHLESHLIGYHGIDNDFNRKAKTFACTVCDFKCTSYGALQKHREKHMLRTSYVALKRVDQDFGRKSKSFICTVCDFKCSSYATLKVHRGKHLSSTSDVDLKRKTKSKTFSCTVCGFKCRSNEALLEHKGRHYLPTSYVCQICSTEFNKGSDLRSHVATHTDEKSVILAAEAERLNAKPVTRKFSPIFKDVYTCKICGYYFQCPKHLRWHLLIHDKKKYYDCSECKYKTVKRYNLKMHKDQQHFNNQIRVQ